MNIEQMKDAIKKDDSFRGGVLYAINHIIDLANQSHIPAGAARFASIAPFVNKIRDELSIVICRHNHVAAECMDCLDPKNSQDE